MSKAKPRGLADLLRLFPGGNERELSKVTAPAAGFRTTSATAGANNLLSSPT
jgi:hypothetical protein